MALTSSSFPLPSLSGQLHCCWGNRDSWKRRNQPEKEKGNEEGDERKGKTIYENILITNNSFTDVSIGDLCWRWECLLLRNTDYWRRRSHTLLNTSIIYLSRMAFSQHVLIMCEDLPSYTSQTLKQLNLLIYFCVSKSSPTQIKTQKLVTYATKLLRDYSLI